MDQSPVGTWKIISTEVRGEDGSITYPDGRDPKGYLIYGEDGYFSLAIMRSGRTSYASGDFRGGTTEEKAAAADSFVAYCGKYSMGEGTVTHHIEVSLYPNWVGTQQERFIETIDERLYLSTPPFLINDKSQTAHLIWERVNDTPDLK